MKTKNVYCQDTAMNPSIDTPSRSKSNVFESVVPWLFVLFSESFLPLAVSVVAGYLLFFIPQAQEVLLGLLGPAIDSAIGNGTKNISSFAFWPLCWLFVMTVAFAFAVWYSSRLLVTIDSHQRVPRCLGQPLATCSLKRAIQDVPRLLGSFSAAFVISGFLSAQRLEGESSWRLVSLFLAATLVPVFAAYAAQLYFSWQLFVNRPKREQWYLSAAIVTVLWMFEVLVVVWAIPSSNMQAPVVICEAAIALMPVVLFSFFVMRRRIVQHVKRNWQVPQASAEMAFHTGFIRLAIIVVASGAALGVLGYGSVSYVRPFGSAAVVLLFLCSFLGIGAACTLLVRHWARGIPGAALAFATLALVALSFQTELTGKESLEVPTTTERTAIKPQNPGTGTKFVINAYGGGLRAAIYTALLLADLDDQSCGAFGGRLDRLSGVSGGSLGIAVYMTLRQEYVASGGWYDCSTHSPSKREFRGLVERALVQDHLSASLGRFLARDIWPYGSAQRGQALLESWQGGVVSAIQERQLSLPSTVDKRADLMTFTRGLAMPLNHLNGGLAAAPTVYFNATDIDTGRRVWMSNRGGSSAMADGDPAIAAMTVGQAVLHSARFPTVSPPGDQLLNKSKLQLIDGGYADNSGAATLGEPKQKFNGEKWISIDGNPSLGNCPAEPTNAIAPPTWSGLRALLSVRASQADIAVDNLATKPGIQFSNKLTFDLDAAFAKSIKDDVLRCKEVRKFHNPPLGWYMTSHSMESMKVSITHSSSIVCLAELGLCRPPQ